MGSVPDSDGPPRRGPLPGGEHSAYPLGLAGLISQALELRSQDRYALHPVEAVIQYHSDSAEIPGEEGHACLGFEQAEAHYRAGAQGLRLSEIPQLPQQLRELSRLGVVDRAGRRTLRNWVQETGRVIDEAEFLHRWQAQGKRGGAEHQVYHDEDCGRWFKRLYHGVNLSTLGDYLVRKRLHAVLFPETSYRLEGFTINPKSRELAPVVSQPHVEVDTSRPLVSKEETDDLMASMGFAPVELLHDGVADGGYYAYLHPVTGVLAHDLHDENVVRLPGTDGLAVIDPCIALARRGTWAAIKLAQTGFAPPPDDPVDAVLPSHQPGPDSTAIG
jgi:Serine/Threonine/Tyrosine Kinase found in polyvalent proteins